MQTSCAGLITLTAVGNLRATLCTNDAERKCGGVRLPICGAGLACMDVQTAAAKVRCVSGDLTCEYSMSSTERVNARGMSLMRILVWIATASGHDAAWVTTSHNSALCMCPILLSELLLTRLAKSEANHRNQKLSSNRADLSIRTAAATSGTFSHYSTTAE